MEGYLGQIIMWGPNFTPRNWAFCNGQLLAISSNTALFSLLGTIYGGDGRTTFALPNMQSRVPMHAGQGPGLSFRSLGQTGGSETNTMTVNQMPSHNHTATLRAESQAGNSGNPTGNQLGVVTTGANVYVPPNPSADVPMGPDSILVGGTGGGQPMNNIQPFQVVNFIICLQGIFPSRN